MPQILTMISLIINETYTLHWIFSNHPLIHQVKGHYFCRKEWNAEKRSLQMEIKELSKQITGNEDSLRKCNQDSKKVKWLSRSVLYSTEN